jgi:broad specificity phosphatase PhoE
VNIYLIRHAQTTHNAKGKVFSGVSDVSLSADGVKATELLALNPLWKTIEHIYVTPLIRTHETADILFDKNIERTVVPELAEVNFGDYEGKIITPQNMNEPAFYNWRHNPEACVFPNGESLMEHVENAYRAIINIAQTESFDNVAIVSHATTIRLVLAKLITGNINCFRRIPCDNTCVSLLEADDNKIKIQFINTPM